MARARYAAPFPAPVAAAGAVRTGASARCTRAHRGCRRRRRWWCGPRATIVEQLSGEPLERAINEAQGSGEPQTLLWDLTTAIRAAAGDAHIGALLIDTDDMDSTGQVKLEELAAAIGEFRRSGKKVIAHGSYFLQSQYYLAAQADEIYLDPFGFVLLDGYDRYRMFFKDALDKLGVDMHLFRAGKFKSAAENYTRRDMSSEDRQESEAYLGALWRGYCLGVASARALQSQAIAQYASGYVEAVSAAGGDSAKVAKDNALVTDLKTAQQVEERMIELVGADGSSKSYRQVSVSDYLRATRAEDKLRGKGAAVGVIVASGEILDGKQPPGFVGGDSTAQLLRQARQDDDIRALVLRVDSPGGSVLASEQIYREVRALKEAGKPVVVSMSDVAASGGYYIAAPADEIIASANTITGSIGVFASIPTFNRGSGQTGHQRRRGRHHATVGRLAPGSAAVGRQQQAAAEHGGPYLRAVPESRRHGPRQDPRCGR
jgi:protease-4